MLPATVNAPAAEPPTRVLAAYTAHLTISGRGNIAYDRAARSFLRRWPQVQSWADLPLARQWTAGSATRPFVTFLMVSRRLRPGYDYLVARKLSSFWRDLTGSALQPDRDRFVMAAGELGFSERMASGVASQVIARLLIETGRGLDELTEADLTDLALACQQRQERTGRGWRHYRGAAHTARQALFHLGALDRPAPPAQVPLPLEERMVDIAAPLRAAFIAYLQRKSATCRPKTVSSLATRLAHFGRFLADIDPELASLAALDRRRHIEPFITSLVEATNTVTGEPITLADRARRVHAVGNFLAEITEWGWQEAPSRRLVFGPDLPRLPRPLPRYLPVDADRRLTAALTDALNRLAADALLLQRSCGLRIGELLDLELDAVHEVPEQGSWLKVPLGKLDRIAAPRSAGRPVPAPADREAGSVPVHPSRQTTRSERAAPRAQPGRQRGRSHPRHSAPAQAHLCDRAGQRRGVAAGSDGAARARLGRYEPALRPTVRCHRPDRIRTCPRPGQEPPWSAARRPTRPAAGRRHRRRRLESRTRTQDTPRWRLLPARARARRLAPTPTSASTARASAPTARICPCSPPNAWTRKRLRPTPRWSVPGFLDTDLG